MNRGAPHGKCLKACLLTASLPSFLSGVRLGCQKSSPSFLLLEKSGRLFLCFLASLLASVQAALRRPRHCRLADDDDARLLSSFWPPQPSPSPTLPLPSFFLSFMYFRRSGKSAPKSTESCCCSSSVCSLLHFVARHMHTTFGRHFSELHN